MNVAILTAGGIGSRTHQDIPKQFLNVDNKPIIIYTKPSSSTLILMRFVLLFWKDGIKSSGRMQSNLI